MRPSPEAPGGLGEMCDFQKVCLIGAAGLDLGECIRYHHKRQQPLRRCACSDAGLSVRVGGFAQMDFGERIRYDHTKQRISMRYKLFQSHLSMALLA